MSDLAGRLAKGLAEKDVSIEQVARDLAVERSRLADILSGAGVTNASLAKRLARYFGQDPADWQPVEAAPAPAAKVLDTFATVATVDEIADEEMKIIFDGLAVLAKIEGQFYCFGNVCPHANGPIGDGFIEGFVVECPWHAGRWDVRTGKALTLLATADIPCFETRIVGDDVQARMVPA